MENVKELIVSEALKLLAKNEALNSPQLFVTIDEVMFCVRRFTKGKDVTKHDVKKVLDTEFQSRYDGKQVVYFLKMKN